MKVAELLEQRRENWRQLEQLCVLMEGRARRKQAGAVVVRFASLYRSACADLALADAYQLPSNTQLYLHQLVARAHNQLYRSRRFDFKNWGHELFQAVPRRLLRDRYLWIATIAFWGIFLGAMWLARNSPEFCERLVGKDMMRAMTEQYDDPLNRQNSEISSYMNSFYTLHNTSIGLSCFATGMLFGVGGLIALIFNAAQIGAVYGYMTTTSQWGTFANFTTAHGPFELTAVVLSAAAGMRVGFSQVETHGMSRGAAMQRALREAVPTMGAAVAMFLMAAMIEGFLSPTNVPYPVKATVAIVSSLLLLFYVLILGSRQIPLTDGLIGDVASGGQDWSEGKPRDLAADTGEPHADLQAVAVADPGLRRSASSRGRPTTSESPIPSGGPATRPTEGEQEATSATR